MNTFSITHQLTLQEYRNLNYGLSLRRPLFIIINALAGLFLVYHVLLLFTRRFAILDDDTYSYFLFITVMGVTMLVMVFFMTGRNFRTNYRLKENITYTFSDSGYTVNGESFTSNLDWSGVYKVKIIPGWLLIYQSKTIANLIKTHPIDQKQIEELKHFLKANQFRAKLNW